MKVFRLVHSAHDPVEKGAFLTRASNHSHQKIADGIYFALSRDEALVFAKKPHGHTYSHLLTCDLLGVSEQARHRVESLTSAGVAHAFQVDDRQQAQFIQGRRVVDDMCIHQLIDQSVP